MNLKHDDRKDQRLRDPVHGLIVFSGNDRYEQLAWRLINAREFQRLRRIKQLGFSEFVYPGATHTRFSHSVGVFHTARSLVEMLKKKIGGEFDPDRAQVAICAALLHDVGHGPFSHTFEGVMKKIGRKKSHEDWTYDIISGETEISRILEEEEGEQFRNDVGNLIKQEHPVDIYSSIISSQFDADRLDYLRRDKLMTGTEHGGFDWEWLLNNLEIHSVPLPGEEGLDIVQVEGLVLGRKSLCAAEEYLLGRHHLYSQVYYHKTTRSAEKMLEALLLIIAEYYTEGKQDQISLPKSHPLAIFLEESNNDLQKYLSLDDTIIWSAIALLSFSEDIEVRELSERLYNRNLYKCHDIGSLLLDDTERADFRLLLEDKRKNNIIERNDILEDVIPLSAYKSLSHNKKEYFEKVMIVKSSGSNRPTDIVNVSDIILSIGRSEIYRVYARNEKAALVVEQIMKEVHP